MEKSSEQGDDYNFACIKIFELFACLVLKEIQLNFMSRKIDMKNTSLSPKETVSDLSQNCSRKLKTQKQHGGKHKVPQTMYHGKEKYERTDSGED
jgi:hypothetical protein